MHNDLAVLECKLGREDFGQFIIKEIEKAQAPKTIGIHGTWGTGKTSLLRQIYAQMGGRHALSEKEKAQVKKLGWDKKVHLDKYEEFKPIWFEAWQHQREENILAALLKEIRDQLSWNWRSLGKNISDATEVSVLSILQNINLTISGFGFNYGNSVKDVQKKSKEIADRDLSSPLDSYTHKKLLRKAIADLLNLKNIIGQSIDKNQKNKAIIIIDDLDRCEPDTAFRILESIKVYLNLDNCVFLLGMDAREIERMLAQRYEANSGDEKEGRIHTRNQARLYLEKICQDIYHLPLMDADQRAEYLRFLLGVKKREVSPLAKMVSIAQNFKALPPFPRSIKIFANVLLSHSKRERITTAFSTTAENDLAYQHFYILSYLYAFHPEIHRLIYLYEEFYREKFYAFVRSAPPEPITEGEKDEAHKLMRELQLTHMPQDDIAAMDSRTDRSSSLLFPHESLRQVLWITTLVRETKDINFERLKAMKL